MNIETITVGNIVAFILALAGFIGACGVIFNFASKAFTRAIQKAMKPTNDRLDKLEDAIKQVDIDNTKNYLQENISFMKNGGKLDDVAKLRFKENYDHYTYDLHMNSWVHTAVKKLEKQDKL